MIKRELYMRRIRPFIGKDPIKVMTGVRRSGKSVMLELVKEELLALGVRSEQLITLNFEAMSNAHLCTAQALYAEITERAKEIDGKCYLFFDEIQEVKDWERAVNAFRVELDSDIYITGSNAKLLSGELATVLGGRYVEFVIYPFSFMEFSELYTECMPQIPEGELFLKYLVFGGMPYLANLSYAPEPCRQYLGDIYHSVMLNDIVKRGKIRDVDLLSRILTYLTVNVGTPFSSASIAKFLKNERRMVAADTILNYVRYCEDAHLIHRIDRQDLHGKQVLSTNEKYYLTDHGIREAVWGGNMKDINLVLENIVCMELLRRGYTVNVGKNGTKEIDFVCEKHGQRLYVQVAYLLASEETIRREFGAFEGIDDNYPKYVVTMDEPDLSRSGYRHCNIRKFLTMPEWN